MKESVNVTYTDCIVIFSFAPQCDSLAQEWLDLLWEGRSVAEMKDFPSTREPF